MPLVCLVRTRLKFFYQIVHEIRGIKNVAVNEPAVEYLKKENLLDQVNCKFDDGRLVFSYPEKPVGVKMQINFEEDMVDEETVYDEKINKDAIDETGKSVPENSGKLSNVNEVVKTIVETIEEKSKPIDLEIVKIVDADGNSEIDVE